MLGWVGDIERETLGNDTFRTVLFTGEHTQLTVMRLAPGEDIGLETHDVSDDWAIIVPAGVWHNLTNTGDGELKLYSLYSPPEHPPDTVHRTKAEAEAAEQH